MSVTYQMVSHLGLLPGLFDHYRSVSLVAVDGNLLVYHNISEGGSSVFQITLHKNLNAYHRIEGVPNHASIQVKPRVEIQ
jgi:hypothetical protein